MISDKYIINIGNGTATLNKDIYLTRNDDVVQLQFELNGFTFNDGDLSVFTSSQISIRKPNGDKLVASIENISNGLITWTVQKTLIDELSEMGEFSFQITLTDGTSTLSLPPIYNQLHVSNSLYLETGNSSSTGISTVNKGHIGTGDQSDIFNLDKSYNATQWANGDEITDGKLNKIEQALGYLMDNDVVYISPINNNLSLCEEKLQASNISNDITITLPAINYVAEFTLYLNCENDISVKFVSSADAQEVNLAKGYHKVEFRFLSDWIISL